MDQKLFFEGFEQASLTERLVVVKTCSNCPVRIECENFARSVKHADGVFGGKWFVMGQVRNPFRLKTTKKASSKKAELISA